MSVIIMGLIMWVRYVQTPAESIDVRKSLCPLATAAPIFPAPGVPDTRCPVLSLSPAVGA